MSSNKEHITFNLHAEENVSVKCFLCITIKRCFMKLLTKGNTFFMEEKKSQTM